MTHTVLMFRLMLIITWTTICTRAQLVALLFPGSSVSETALGKPCHTEAHQGVCVKREQCGSAISSIGINMSNPCGPTAGFDVICCGNSTFNDGVISIGENTTRTADILDVSLPDVINPEGVDDEIRWCVFCGDRSRRALTPARFMTEEERKVRMEEISRYSGRSSGNLSRTVRSEPRTDPLLAVPHKSVEELIPHFLEYEDYVHEESNLVGGFEPEPEFRIELNRWVTAWPWMALLGKQRPGKTPSWQCTGTVIRYGYTHKWIITAAHCFNKGLLDIVRLGEHNYTDDSETATSDHWIEKRLVHPEYSVHTGYHDMALIKLSRYPMDINKTNMNPNVSPICLPWGIKISENVVGEEASVVGWGATEFTGSHSPIPQEGHMTIFNSSICDEAYKKGVITEGLYEQKYPDGIQAKYLLCAGRLEGGVDACEGDSGGPLMIGQEEVDSFSRQYYLAGVVSHGAGCGLKEYPGLYTSLYNPAYMAWIKKVAFNTAEPDHCDHLSITLAALFL